MGNKRECSIIGAGPNWHGIQITLHIIKKSTTKQLFNGKYKGTTANDCADVQCDRKYISLSWKQFSYTSHTTGEDEK